MKWFVSSIYLAAVICTVPANADMAGDSSSWTLVKSLVIPSSQPNNPGYTTTTETFLDKNSIVLVEKYKRASFRQSAKDSIGYQMKYGQNKIIKYYYDCRTGQIAGSSEVVPDPARFKTYADFTRDYPKLPFADSEVVKIVCH